MLSELYKLLFDISVCYAIGTFSLGYAAGITINGIQFLFLLVSAALSILLKEKRKLKIFAAILIPVIFLLLFKPALPELAVFLLAWVYCSYVSHTERYEISRGAFADLLKHFLYLCPVVAILMLIAFRNFNIALKAACPYLLTTMISSVALLRLLRADNRMEQMKRYRRQQLIELLIFLIISLLLTIIRVPQNLAAGVKLLYQNLLGPALSLLADILGLLVGGIIYLIIAAVGLLTNRKITERNIDFGKMIGKTTDITAVKGTDANWIAPFLFSISAIAGLAALFFFFRWLMGEKLKQKLPEGILETREYLDNTKAEKGAAKKRHPKNSTAKVRYYYGKVLLWMQQKKADLTPQDTTEEINLKYNQLQLHDYEANKEAAAQLMQLYRKARYQTAEEITKEDAMKAKQSYQKMKNRK